MQKIISNPFVSRITPGHLEITYGIPGDEKPGQEKRKGREGKYER